MKTCGNFVDHVKSFPGDAIHSFIRLPTRKKALPKSDLTSTVTSSKQRRNQQYKNIQNMTWLYLVLDWARHKKDK